MKRFPETLFVMTALLCVLYLTVEHIGFGFLSSEPLAAVHQDAKPTRGPVHDNPDEALAPIPLPRPSSTRPSSGAGKKPVGAASSFTADDVGERASVAFQEGRQAALKEIDDRKQQDTLKTYVMIAITVILLLCGVAVILMERYDANQKHWSYAILGTIVGFWLR